uniref:Uncharacterized protein n=1 Tax=Arundo donax TaxID=35708 RepID=A0A0A9HJM3_ARUDO
MLSYHCHRKKHHPNIMALRNRASKAQTVLPHMLLDVVLMFNLPSSNEGSLACYHFPKAYPYLPLS